MSSSSSVRLTIGIRSDGREVVAVKRDVEDAVERRAPSRASILSRDARRAEHRGGECRQYKVLGTVIFFDDLGREPTKGHVSCGLVHYPRLFDQSCFDVSHSNANRNKPRLNSKLATLASGL